MVVVVVVVVMVMVIAVAMRMVVRMPMIMAVVVVMRVGVGVRVRVRLDGHLLVAVHRGNLNVRRRDVALPIVQSTQSAGAAEAAPVASRFHANPYIHTYPAPHYAARLEPPLPLQLPDAPQPR